MKQLFFTIYFFFLIFNVKSQNKVRFPVWTLHDDSTTIQGLSLGLNTSINISNVKVNGVNFELLGFGLLIPLAPSSPIKANDQTLKSEFLSDTIELKVNGLNISPSGSFCECNINGLNLNGMGSGSNIANGLSLALFANFANILNGVQVSAFGNEVAFFNGVQFAFFTNSSQTNSKGIQVSALNHANKHSGVQFGIVNKAESLKGIQIGLWNKNSIRSLPILNWNFKS